MVSLCLLIFFILLRLHFLHLNCRLLLFCLISKLCLFCCLEISINNSALYSTFFCPAPDLQAPFVLLSYMFYQCCRLLLPCLIHKLRLFCHVLHVLSTLSSPSALVSVLKKKRIRNPSLQYRLAKEPTVKLNGLTKKF